MMPFETLSHKKESKINMRIDPRSKDLIDAAARFQGQKRSTFMIEAALKDAEKVLMNQNHFSLSEKDWAAFHKALTDSPKPNKKLKHLLTSKDPWK